MDMFSSELTIGEHRIGSAHPVFLVAEAGVNHNGDLEIAKHLVDAVKASGAHAVKFQSFTAESLVSKRTPKVRHHIDPTNPSETHFDMIKRLEIDEAFQQKVFEYCTEQEIIFLSTPYDVASARFLHERLDVAAFKTASADIVDIPLQTYIASTGKPAIIAVGMATLDEIQTVLDIYEQAGNPNVILLHCTSSYPAPHASLNLRVMETIRNRFQVLVGYSDHSVGPVAGIVSTALGSCLLEKHFTLDRQMPGPDHKASIEPNEFCELSEQIRLTKTMLGSSTKEVQPEEMDMRQFSRKSLVAARNIKAGEIITEADLVMKRPGTGLGWNERALLIGSIAARDIESDEVLSIDIIINTSSV